MGSMRSYDRMPEGVRSVEFTELQRLPSGLTRVATASEVRTIFLEKGCVVVRELVEEVSRKVVRSVALPLNSGLVRTITLEDEVVEEARKEGQTGHVVPSADPFPVLPPSFQGASVVEPMQRTSGEGPAQQDVQVPEAAPSRPRRR